MTKINSQQLVDHAADLLDDKNNFKVYFDDFNKNYVTSNFENFEKFKNNWKAIIYVVIKGVYARFATEGHVELNEYLLALEGLLKKGFFLLSDAAQNKSLIELYSEEYVKGGHDLSIILSKNCFNGKMNDETINLVRNSISALESTFEDTVGIKFK